MGIRPRWTRFAIAVALLGLLAACSDSGSSDKHEHARSGATAGGGSGGNAGTGAAGSTGGLAGAGGSSTAAGTGGAAGASAGSGGSAGSNMAGSGGAGAGAQQGGAEKPSTDCSTHTETNHCFSFKGVLDGRPFDKTCLMDTGGLRQDVTINHAWSVSCEDTVTHAYAVVSIEQQMAGAFHYTADQQDGFTVGIDVFDGMSDAMSGMPSVSDALIEGDVQMAGTHPLLVGTFHATWAASMASGCPSDGCPAATITGSFRSEFDF